MTDWRMSQEIIGTCVPGATLRGGAPRLEPLVQTSGRVLDRMAVRGRLEPAPGSVRWAIRFTTFDRVGPKELPVTRLDRKGRQEAERALLNRSPGGTSNLGPALGQVERSGYPGKRLLIVESDFLLMDPSVPQVLDDLKRSSADAVLALVFNAPAPSALLDSDIVVVTIDPQHEDPAAVAKHVVAFANQFVSSFEGRARRELDVLLDVIDDESGSMWGGNDATGLRHEALLIAVEHLSSRPQRTSKNKRNRR